MELIIYTPTKEAKGKRTLPRQFEEAIRPDLIARAVDVIRSNSRQAYGAAPQAGLRQSAKLSRRRHDYKASYGHGISRVPRKIMSGKGSRWNWGGAVAPGTVGGRRAHPPKAWKIWKKDINVKERRKAIRSAIAATVSAELVRKRGHKAPQEYPFVIDASFESLAKAKDMKEALIALGMAGELARTSAKSVRSGKGKSRARKYRKKKGILFIVSGTCSLQKAAKNLPGSDVIEVRNLNAEALAPGSAPGRIALWTAPAIDLLEKEGMFL